MAKKSENQRQGRLTNPVVATKMYEALVQIASMKSATELESVLSKVEEVLDFVRNKEVIDMATEADMKKTEVVPELVCEPMPTRYTVRLGVKIPSRIEQYRNMEANVAVSSNDPDAAMTEAQQQFVKAAVTVCNTMGETPPDEIRPSVEEIYAGDTALIYGEGE